MEAEKFLESAKIIIEGGQEVDYRNATSRAYYCAFHLCRNFLNTLLHAQISDQASHEAVIGELINSPDNKLRKLGNKLRQAKRSRHIADYKLFHEFSYHEAKQTIKHSYEIKIELEDISK